VDSLGSWWLEDTEQQLLLRNGDLPVEEEDDDGNSNLK